MHRYIWLVPILPLLGAAINGLLGRKLRFSETVVSAIAVGSVALAFLISVMAVYSYGTGERWPRAYVTSESGGFPYSFTWISGGTVELSTGTRERAEMESNKQFETATRVQSQAKGVTPERPALVYGPRVPE